MKVLDVLGPQDMGENTLKMKETWVPMVSVIFVEIFSARRLLPLKELKNQVESVQRKYSKETPPLHYGVVVSTFQDTI